MSPVFASINNNIFATGVFASEFQHEKIVPVFKKVERHDLANYRPITILPCFTK